MCRCPAVGGRRRPADEQARRLRLDRDVGEQLLDELEARDRPPELPAVLRVRDRRVEAALRDADAPGAERDAPVVECRHGDLEPAAHLAEHAVRRHPHAVEEELRRVLRAQAELALDRPRLEAGRVRRHDEAGDAARPRLAGAREDERVRRPGAERDEDLLSRQHPAVAVPFGAGLEPARVGARTRLRQRVAAELGPGCQPGQQRRLLRRRAPAGHRLPVEPVRDRDDPANVRVGPPDLLDDERVRDHVEAHPAVLLRQRRGEEAELRELRDDAAVDLLGAVPLGGVRRDLGVAERARGLPDQLLLVAQREVHAADPTHKKTAERVALSSTSPTGRFGPGGLLAVARRGFALHAPPRSAGAALYDADASPRKSARTRKARSFRQLQLPG